MDLFQLHDDSGDIFAHISKVEKVAIQILIMIRLLAIRFKLNVDKYAKHLTDIAHSLINFGIKNEISDIMSVLFTAIIDKGH